MIKVDRELPEPFDSCVCAVCEFIRDKGTIPRHSLVKAGLAVEPLIDTDDILLEPKSTRTIRGKIISRERAKFVTEPLIKEE